VRALDALVEQATAAGPIAGVVHAAGVQIRKPALDMTVDDWDAVQRIHLAAPFFLSTALARTQRDAGIAASHLFVGSLTSYVGIPNIAPYAAAKSGLLGVVRSLAVEWAGSGLRVNAIAPGYFHTELTDELLKDEASAERIRGRIPLGRLGVEDDLAGAAIFLLSGASAYVTGQVVAIDGGSLASWL
jgi:2-dehydro-3-deoxy-D-gluconate 5-dehydrogenase